MEWLEPSWPLGGALSAFVALLTWLIKRGDRVNGSNVAELRRQRDEAIERETALRAANELLRGHVIELEDEVHIYRRLYGPLDGTETLQ